MPLVSRLTRRLKPKAKTILPTLPQSLQRLVGQVDYRFAKKPCVWRPPAIAATQLKGTVTFSLDFELAWGWSHASLSATEIVAKGLRERQQVPWILAAFDIYGIPGTWATVGHLFLSSCRRSGCGLAHSEMPRLNHFTSENWQHQSGDWYDSDPCSSVRSDPAWYAPDLIDEILSSKVDHEIGCHTFSHAGFGEYCTPQVASAELEGCRAAMAPFGLLPTTFVFPGNEEGNYEVLSQQGIQVVRAFPEPSVQISLPVVRPDGIWAIAASSPLDRGRRWSVTQRLNRLKTLVDKAAESKMGAHFWLHPSLKPDDVENIFFPLLRYCADQRERGMIDAVTMKEAVARVNSEDPANGRLATA